MTKPNKNWEKEFDKKFIDCKDGWGVNAVGYGVTKRKIKNFIKTLMIDTLEKITKENFTMIENIEGYNSAVKDLNQRIEEIKKRFL